MIDCHLGLGGMLMRHLRTALRAIALKRVYFFGATANAPLRELNRALGFNSAIEPDSNAHVAVAWWGEQH